MKISVYDGDFFACDFGEGLRVEYKKKNQKFYVVKPLDNIQKISRFLNVEKEELEKINQVDLTNVFIGQKIYY